MDAETTQPSQSADPTEIYVKFMGWLHANRKKLIIACGAIVVIALVVAVISWQKSVTEADANAALLDVPMATVRGERATPTLAQPFLDVAKQYPDTDSGEYAALLAAEALFTEGKYPEAHQQFSQFIEKYPSSALIPQASVGVAAALEGEGKIQEAAQKYQQLIASYPTEPGILSPAKLTLARLDEQLNKPEQALSYYQDLARVNNPYDPWASEARERGNLLLMKHPELRKAPPSAATAPTGRPGAAPGAGMSLFPSQGAPRPAPAQAPAKPAPNSPAKPQP